jgi:hypothetical protein
MATVVSLFLTGKENSLGSRGIRAQKRRRMLVLVAFMQVVHSVALGNNELLYVCDRQGDRIQVFDKMGNITNSEVVTNKDAELVGCERRTGADGSVKL